MEQTSLYIGADHGGFELKKFLLDQIVQNENYQLIDCGAFELDPQDDYPQFAFQVAEQVQKNDHAKGVVLCRSGAGVIIAANKVTGIRAVLVKTPAEVEHAVQHNNANVIALSADEIDHDQAAVIVQTFLNTQFNQEERHQRRIDQITMYGQKTRE